VPFILRHIPSPANLADHLALEALASSIPHSTIQAVILDLNATQPRRRSLPADVTLLFTVAMSLFSHQALADVFDSMTSGLRFVMPDTEAGPVSKSAICQARYRLGARPTVELFHRICLPCATPDTPEAFRFGLRLMAVDGTKEAIPDSPANAAAFGYPATKDGGHGALPQVQAVYLVECGTHMIVDAGFWSYNTNERIGALRLLRSLQPGMLLMWDQGFHGYPMASTTRKHKAQFLGRVPKNVVLTAHKYLPDGSYLAWLRPADRGPVAARRVAPILVRVVEYTLDAPGRTGHGEHHRLMTSLVEWEEAGALELVLCYHERWEEELVIDEVDTHLRVVQHPLRSQKPVGVIQELYGVLLAHYAVRRVMVDAAKGAGVAPRRLSFVHTVHVVRRAVAEFQQVAEEQRPVLYGRLLRDVARGRLPARDGRLNPRVVRRQQSKFPVKRAHHCAAPRLKKSFRETVVLLN
jgi:hypothetical protein